MLLEAKFDVFTGRLTIQDLDQGDGAIGFVEERGSLLLAVVGQDDPATTWERTFDDWDRAAAAICIEIARRDKLKNGAAP